MYVICTECVWQMFGICREYARNRYGQSMEVWRRYGAARYCNYLVKAATLLTEQWATYARTMDGICMEYVWNVRGICMEHVWNTCGICMGCVRNIYGMPMQYAWNMYGVCMEY